jgi:hypothetical protein
MRAQVRMGVREISVAMQVAAKALVRQGRDHAWRVSLTGKLSRSQAHLSGSSLEQPESRRRRVDMSGAMAVVMVVMMVVMMGGMMLGGAWALIRRRRGKRDDR